MVFVDENRVDKVVEVPPFKHTGDFATVVFAGIEAALSGRFRELLVRALVGQGVGDGVAGIPWRQHPATMRVGFTAAELLAVDEFAGEHDGLNQLLDRLEIAEFGDVGF